MATPDLYSLLMAPDEGTAAERSAAMQAALRRDKALGTLGVLSGDAVLSKMGGQMTADATHGIDRIGTAQQQRLTNALGQQRIAQEGAARAQGFRLQAARQAMEVDRADREDAYRKQMLGLQHARLAKENGDWAFAPNPVTGAPAAFNKKTREYAPLGDGPAPGANGEPAALPPMKPQDQRAAVERLSKGQVEWAGAVPDLLELYKTAEAGGDIAGFGIEYTPADMVGLGDAAAAQFGGAEGIANRQRAGRVKAAFLKAQSGAGVTEGERKDIARNLGLIENGTPEQMRIGLEGLMELSRSKMAAHEAGFDPETLKIYSSRPGAIVSTRLPRPKAPAAAPAAKPAVSAKADPYAEFRAQVKPGERLVSRGGEAFVLEAGEAPLPGDVEI